ncbi:hypothetical protein ALC57_18115, partial [Trachymyrmex cornetzi]
SPSTSRASNERTSITQTIRSPSYAAVTAAPSTRSISSSTIARSKTVAKACSTNSRKRHKSDASIATSEEGRRSGEAAAMRKSPMTATVSKPRVVSVKVVRLLVKTIQKAGVQNAVKSARAPSHPPQRTSSEAMGPRRAVEKEKCGEGAYRKLLANKERPISSRTRRATSVPVENSETTRRGRISPHPPRNKDNYIINIISTEPPITTFYEGVVTRSISAPVEKSAVDARLNALDRPSSRATGNSTSPIAGGLNINTNQLEKMPPPMLPSLPLTTRGSPSGSPGEILIFFSPATSLPITLTTGTMTTTTCGSPITSTGFTGGVGRQTTPPIIPFNSESPTIAGPSRSSRIAPLCALIAASMNQHDRSLNVERMNDNICLEKTPPRNILPVGTERRRRETSPEDHAEGDVGNGTGTKVSAERPSAPIYVRGVMARRRAATSPAVPPRVDVGEGGHPAPATVTRQLRHERVAARDVLLDRAKDVATIAELEAFATSVAAFFGEEASTTGAAARVRDRSEWSREAGARRGARGGKPLERFSFLHSLGEETPSCATRKIASLSRDRIQIPKTRHL